jgi:hypothetical protein
VNVIILGIACAIVCIRYFLSVMHGINIIGSAAWDFMSRVNRFTITRLLTAGRAPTMPSKYPVRQSQQLERCGNLHNPCLTRVDGFR